MTPVAQGAGNVDSLLPAEEAQKVKDVPQVDVGDVDVEAVANEDPDIIFVPNMAEESVVEKLRAVAPVYVYTHAGADRSDWQLRGDEIADAMNLNDRLDEVKAELADRQQEIKDEYGDVLSGFTATAFASWDADEFTTMGPGSMPGTILSPAGLQWDENTTEATKDIPGQELGSSMESIHERLAEADVLFYGTGLFGEPDPFTQEMMDSTTFSELPAAKAGKVFPLGKSTVAGYMDAFAMRDMLEETLKQLK